MRFALVACAVLALSATAFAQEDGPFKVGYAANLTIGDSVLNISNDGFNGGVFGTIPPTLGNICANLYVFDPQEEEIGCCSCLVTPNGINSLSVKSDLISNNLTPAVPTSVTATLVGSVPDLDANAAYTVCNPALVETGTAIQGNAGVTSRLNTSGLLAWGTTLEPSSTPGVFKPVEVRFLETSRLDTGTRAVPHQIINGNVIVSIVTFFPDPSAELTGLTSLCNFIQSNGTSYGICKSCRLGALGGAKQ